MSAGVRLAIDFSLTKHGNASGVQDIRTLFFFPRNGRQSDLLRCWKLWRWRDENKERLPWRDARMRDELEAGGEGYRLARALA